MRLPLALLTLLCVLPLTGYGQSPGSTLKKKQLSKAEGLIKQLEQLDNLMNSGPNSASYKAQIAKLSEGFSRTAASLPESDLKTDLGTAVYWYDQLALNLSHSAAPGAYEFNAAAGTKRCGNERPGLYQKLCESTSGSARDLIWAKARLHMHWARAGVLFQKTGQVERPLDDVAVERRFDQTLAGRLIQSLKVLENQVVIYRSLGEFEASSKLARVPLADFKRELFRVSAGAESALSWLPQNRLKNELSNALHSFQDGAFWWEQIDQPRVVKVSDLAFRDTNRSSSDTALIATVPYTVAINWRHGSQYLKRAEQILNDQAR